MSSAKMVYNNSDYESMLDHILEWAKWNSKFDARTMQGIRDTLNDNRTITFSQMNAISNVYYKWKIDEWVASKRDEYLRHIYCLKELGIE
jgi:hypothetical protein